MNKQWLSAFIALTATGTVFGSISPAQAISLQVVDVNDSFVNGVHSGPDGTFERLVRPNPGIYGLEARGGRPGAQDWEIGVGTQTSRTGSFSENKFFDDDWGDGSTLYDLVMTWTPGANVSVTIGDTTVTYAADWQVGNAIEIFAVRSAFFQLTELDGLAFDETVGQIGSPTNEKLFLAGDSLLDGWILKGQIAMVAGGGSRNEVMITTGTFTPPEDVPEPAALLGFLAIGAIAAGRKLQSQSA